MPYNNYTTRKMLFGAVPQRQPQVGMPFLGPNRQPTGDTQPSGGSVVSGTGGPDYMSLYNQPSPALDMYKQQVASMPSREDYKSTKLNRLGAAFVGASEGLHHGGGAGAKAAQDFLDSNYNTAMEDYRNKTSNLGTLANIEGADTKRKIDFLSDYEKNKRESIATDANVRNINSEIATREKLTPAQVANLTSQAATRGITYQHNKTTGELMQIKPDGTSVSMGKYDLTPEQAAQLDIKTYGAKQGIELGNAKSLFSWKAPQELTNAKDLHLSNRQADAANPIPIDSQTGFRPAQQNIADQLAVTQVLREYPGFSIFNVSDPSRVAAKNSKQYKQYLAHIKIAKDNILKMGNATPKVSTSPLAGPNVKTDPLRGPAIAALKATNKDETDEANIQEVIRQMKAGQ